MPSAYNHTLKSRWKEYRNQLLVTGQTQINDVIQSGFTFCGFWKVSCEINTEGHSCPYSNPAFSIFHVILADKSCILTLKIIIPSQCCDKNFMFSFCASLIFLREGVDLESYKYVYLEGGKMQNLAHSVMIVLIHRSIAYCVKQLNRM